MSHNITTQILIAREIKGEWIDDIAVDVTATYAPPAIPFRNDPDDCPEVQIEKCFVAQDARNMKGEIVFASGSAIVLTPAEERDAERVCLETA